MILPEPKATTRRRITAGSEQNGLLWMILGKVFAQKTSHQSEIEQV
jgi:hypothetical protein